MHLYERRRLHSVIREIFFLFNPKEGPSKRKIRVPQLKGSPVTVIRARQALHCQSKKVGGRWYWFAPKRTLEEALNSLGRKGKMYKVKQDRREEEVQEIKDMIPDVFKAFGYVIKAKEAYLHICGAVGRKYPKGPVYKAKREIGVRRYFRPNGVVVWAYPAPEVLSWLEEQLTAGPVFREVIVKKSPWPREALAIHVTPRINGTTSIHAYYNKDKCYWYDLNNWSPPLTKVKPQFYSMIEERR